MILATESASTWVLGGVLIAAILRAITSDLVWRNVVKEVRTELSDCRDGREKQRAAHASERAEWREDKAKLETEVRSLQGEVIALRRDVNEDRWLGVDRNSRPPKEQP